ncbi:hypothetical protein [Sphingobacterium sp.]|uniref:hypothetical protein n=1 Tax=Sphingobacterium sp. TaxID=341027 RepID=UPI002587DC5F|nr:hypothetical protein [Sphingobacterium sp.]WET67105.1 MAG: hypothetical protein P0Y57_14815 [Sphingobacterium sp.]
MRSNYAHLILLDMIIYETHREEYDPIKNVQDFWEKYSLSTIHEHIVVLQPDVENTEKKHSVDHLSTFSVDVLRTLIAYFMMHLDKVDIGKITISTTVNEEELKITKKISDFFNRVSPSNTNS